MEPDCLSLENVRSYMQFMGCKVPNHELVKQFKKYLNDPNTKDTARLLFKDIVNTIATVQKEGTNKYLVLKPSYILAEVEPPHEDDYETVLSEPVTSMSTSPPSTSDASSSPPPPPDVVPTYTVTSSVPDLSLYSPPPYTETPLREAIDMRPSQIAFETPVSGDQLSHSQSSPNLLNQYSSAGELDEDHPDSGPMDEELEGVKLRRHHRHDRDGQSDAGSHDSLLSPPQPPPRRRALSRGKENRGTKIEETVRQLKEERDSLSPPKTLNREELSLSPGIVKERAERLNKMASSEIDLPSKNLSNSRLFSSCSSLNSNTGIKRLPKNTEDDDSSSVTSLDPLRKEWLVKAAKGDYHALAKLLKEEPKLAGFKDYVSGFTALHWAAKHGNSDMVKLVAGSHKINPNVRSHGGYTPLHIAALFGHEEIMELLVNTYGADPSLRDYSGKRPPQYLPRTPYALNFYHRGGPDERKQRSPSNCSIPDSWSPGGQPRSLPIGEANPQSPNTKPYLLPFTQQPALGFGLGTRTPSPGLTSLPYAGAIDETGQRRTSNTSTTSEGEGGKNTMSRGGFFRNSLHQSFLRATRPSIRKKLKYKQAD